MRDATALPMFNVNGRKFIEHMSTYTVNITYPGNLPFYLYDEQYVDVIPQNSTVNNVTKLKHPVCILSI